MGHRACCVVVATLGILLAGEASARDAQTSMVVRTYTGPDSERDLPAATRTASAILERADIEVAWIECGIPAVLAETAAACAEPLRANEVVVRIVHAGTADRRPHADTMGFAHVDLDAGGGSLATVYWDRVRLIALRARADAAELLGRAIAHEIGHLLLGTNRHRSRGLMRASWSDADLRRNPATLWLFSAKDAGLMRRAIASRAPSVEADRGAPLTHMAETIP